MPCGGNLCVRWHPSSLPELGWYAVESRRDLHAIAAIHFAHRNISAFPTGGVHAA